MPKKRTAESSAAKSDPIVAGSDDESGTEKAPRPKKKSKINSVASKATVEPTRGEGSSKAGASGLKNSDGEAYVDLGSRKRVTVRKFNKMTLVDIREFYLDKSSGEEKPGKKGISLTVAQFEALKANLSTIEEAVASLA